MSVAYHAVGWNRQKRLYDFTLAGMILLGLASFGLTAALVHPAMTAETFLIRFTSVSALLLLHVILAIGPLARLDPRFLPLLYNRRHLGVTMFFLALAHGILATFQFHALGDKNPLVSLFSSYRHDYLAFLSHPAGISRFPFEALGAAALLILLVMAATSHDFWLRNLGPSVWKTLHLLVYLAYGLILAHVFLGALQSERSPAYPALLGAGFAVLVTLHLLAYRKERRFDRQKRQAEADGYVRAGLARDLEPDAGKVAVINGERIALFLKDGRIFALSNACRHQGGPLGEGRIVDGCLTCPWHGYQYHVEDGCSPPPFTEVVPTYAVRVIDGAIYVNPEPLPLKTSSAGAPAAAAEASGVDAPFYIGWQDKSPAALAGHTRRVVAGLGIFVASSMALVAWQQNPIDDGTFEFGQTRSFEGILYGSPIPVLHVPGGPGGGGLNFVLVGEGKHGPPAVVESAHGKRVRLTGTLVHRHGMHMIEVPARPETFQVISGAAPGNQPPPVIALGEGNFTGELVDTKCFFGVMRPATGKVHRACAIRCLSGGVPPGLLVRDADGNGVVLMLAGADGKRLDYDVEWAARLMRVTGALEIHGDTPVLRVASITLL